MVYRTGYDERMEEEPGKQEAAPYNLRTDFESTKEAMAYVERGGWLYSEKRIAGDWDHASEGERHGSLEGVRRWLESVDPSAEVRRTVYGDGGIDRWYVRADGSVSFSRFHSSPPTLQRAQEKKFVIE